MITVRFEKENNCAAAYDDEKQIGICNYQVSGDKWNIYHTFTESEYGGQGIARKMVECVAEQALQSGAALEATCWYAKKVLK